MNYSFFNRFYSFFPVSAAILLVAGCTTVPPLETPTNRIPVSKIVERVKCDLVDALKNHPELLKMNAFENGEDKKDKEDKGWAATVTLDLQVDATSGISPGVSFVSPLRQVVDKARGNFPQSFTFGLGGGVNGKASRLESLMFKLPLKDIRNVKNPNCSFEDTERLDSDLGLDEWLVLALEPMTRKPPILSPKEMTLISHEIDFLVTWNLNATPSWSLVHFKGPGAGGGSSAGGASGASTGGGGSSSLFSTQRIDTHKLKISLAPNTNKGDTAVANTELKNTLRAIAFPQ